MYGPIERHASYKRAALYFIAYSAVLFFTTSATFLSLKTVPYFFIGLALSGGVAALFMMIQFKVEQELNPNFWILNIPLEIIGYYIYVHFIFSLFYSI